MIEWCQRLRADWDVACYGRGFGDILKGLPGRAVSRVNAAPVCGGAISFPIVNLLSNSDANERWAFGCGVRIVCWSFVSHIVQQLCSAPASETVEGAREGAEGGRMQDARHRDGSPQQDMRRDDQAVGLSYGICSRRWDDGLWLARIGTNRAEKQQEGCVDGTGTRGRGVKVSFFSGHS